MSLMLCNEKIDVVQSWPIPSNVKEVRDFLGLTGYYRHFVQNYGLIARPLTALIKKNGFVLSNEAFSVFITSKQALLSTLVLWLPDFSKTFVVECDASSSEVGVVLSQEEHPVAYFRKGFSPSSWFKPTYDQELLGLVLIIQKWSHYLLGSNFLILYDQDPPSLLPYVMGETKNIELEQLLIDRDDMFTLFRFNLMKVQDRMRNQANSKCQELSPRFFSPYRGKRIIGPIAYELELPDDAKIHQVFYISMLKPVYGSFFPDLVAPLPIPKDWEIDIQSASIVDHR
uniref:Retrotransposon-related protein n=1 Tax=Tanacetum cinerariifolium TaxID=118510 RepID=A0A699KWN3_TANCI|nr:retrotransposon-related protein [Tanacetum cinerariifolium]